MTSEPSLNADYVRVCHDSFGVVYQLWRGNVLVDAYAPWNGDPEPEWFTVAHNGSLGMP